MKRKRWLLAGLIVLTLIAVIIATTHVDYDGGRDVWSVGSLGMISFTCMNDQAKGSVCWFYMQDTFVGHWPVERRTMPTPYPTSTPYPTGTPYPTYTPPGIQSA